MREKNWAEPDPDNAVLPSIKKMTPCCKPDSHRKVLLSDTNMAVVPQQSGDSICCLDIDNQPLTVVIHSVIKPFGTNIYLRADKRHLLI